MTQAASAVFKAPPLHRPAARPGRALLNTGDGTLTTVAVPFG